MRFSLCYEMYEHCKILQLVFQNLEIHQDFMPNWDAEMQKPTDPQNLCTIKNKIFEIYFGDVWWNSLCIRLSPGLIRNV